ncbi:MAG: sulfite exporter TauE/SafE family protein [Rhodoplanes sp.]|uniref:sulfite exporter TauE/SafE family protein n=1 Tax=Rhodoplanes sp. TaxID=1968906 RepID=UPI0017EA522A|nr:sulfite exporter TauE/SafE family protein [Rhodoplanes sp.]NVO16649.1 sulfite exporter TauE/SafE family protein [Rhodoplanes sp.]
MLDLSTILATLAIILFAGTVKGVVGLGLPALSIGLLGLIMPPAEAVALVMVPALVTNIWQMCAGPHLSALTLRLWPLLLSGFLATLVGLWTGFLAADHGGAASAAIGAVLVTYGALGLSPLRLSVPPRREPWLAPVMGAVSGLVASFTGIVMVPAVPYMEALGLRRDELVQAVGLFFTVSSAALLLGLAQAGVMGTSVAALSVASLVPAVAGMAAGQWVRRRIRPDAFRVVFFLGLIGLGIHLLARVVL